MTTMTEAMQKAGPPAHFIKLDPGVKCRCVRLWTDMFEQSWCCGGNNVTQLVPNRPDADVAAELRAETEAALKPVLVIMDKALAAGFVVGWQIGPVPPTMKNQVQGLTVIKHF